MPIGKNAIKRVTNGGYSSVVSKAPDMENSVELVVEKTEQVKVTPAVKKPAATKKAPATNKPATAKKTTSQKTAKQPSKTASTKETRCGACYINIGGKLPIYLL